MNANNELMEVGIEGLLQVEIPFDNRETLVQIANNAIQEGVISGWQILPIDTGFLWNGNVETKKNFLLASIIPQNLKESVIKYFSERIKEYWEVPLVTIRDVETNAEFSY